jgi:hypothetical protein
MFDAQLVAGGPLEFACDLGQDRDQICNMRRTSHVILFGVAAITVPKYVSVASESVSAATSTDWNHF